MEVRPNVEGFRAALEMLDSVLESWGEVCSWYMSSRPDPYDEYLAGRRDFLAPKLDGHLDKLLYLKDTLLRMQKVPNGLDEVDIDKVAPLFRKLHVDVIRKPGTDTIMLDTGTGSPPCARP